MRYLKRCNMIGACVCVLLTWGCGGGNTKNAQCANGERGERACGAHNLGVQVLTCDDNQWVTLGGCDDDSVCFGVDERADACGLNDRGQQWRECIEGLWHVSDICYDGDVCIEGTEKFGVCGLSNQGKIILGCTSGQWIEKDLQCDESLACERGDVETLACGQNWQGEMIRQCVDEEWTVVQACQDPDECINGDVTNFSCPTNPDERQPVTCLGGAWVPDRGSSCETLSTCAPGEFLDVDASGDDAGDDSFLHCRPCREKHYCPGGREAPVFCGELYAGDGATPCLKLTAVEAGRWGSCVLDERGKAHCWSQNQWQDEYTVPEDFPPAVGLSGTCAYLEGGGIRCWHEHENAPDNYDDFIKIEMGSSHSCALDTNHQMHCWGYGTYGEEQVPSDLGDVVDIGVDGQSCALLADGSVKCWGHIELVLGSGDLRDIVKLGVGPTLNCALDSQNDIHCWGWSGYGERTPDLPANFGRIADVQGGYGFGCALSEQNEVACWGNDGRDIVSPPRTLGKATQLSVASNHACALSEKGRVVCWPAGPHYNPADGDDHLHLTPREFAP